MEDPVEEAIVHGYSVKVYYDRFDSQSPREWDNLGTIVHWHRRYDLGEQISDPGEFLASLPKGSVVLPVSMYDHSGVTIWVGSGTASCDSAGWDSGQVGFIYATPDTIRKEFGKKRITAKIRKRVEEILTSEIKEYDDYLTGQVFGYVVENPDGEQEESCWGFIGESKYCLEEGISMAKACFRHAKEQAEADAYAAIHGALGANI